MLYDNYHNVISLHHLLPNVWLLWMVYSSFFKGWYGTMWHGGGNPWLHFSRGTEVSGRRRLLWPRVWLVVCGSFPLWDARRWVDGWTCRARETDRERLAGRQQERQTENGQWDRREMMDRKAERNTVNQTDGFKAQREIRGHVARCRSV